MDAAVTPLLAALANPAPSDLLVRVVSLRGFGLRDAGDGAVVRSTHSGAVVDGTVLGHMIDQRLIAEAEQEEQQSNKRRQIRESVTDRDADAAGMVCGGSARILISPVSDLPPELGALLEQAQPLALVTAADGSTGDLLVTRKATAGSIGPTLDPHTDRLVAAARSLLAGGGTTTELVDVDGAEIMISTIVPSTRFLVVGSGPMAEAISAQGALLGWTAELSESVEAAEAFVRQAGPADGLAVLSHDAEVDVPILHAALGSAIGYVGGMGSRGTQTRRRNSLGELGHGEADIDRIHGPIGLDLGSRTPAETAVAVVAEFLANRSGRAPDSLRSASGPING